MIIVVVDRILAEWKNCKGVRIGGFQEDYRLEDGGKRRGRGWMKRRGCRYRRSRRLSFEGSGIESVIREDLHLNRRMKTW